VEFVCARGEDRENVTRDESIVLLLDTTEKKESLKSHKFKVSAVDIDEERGVVKVSYKHTHRIGGDKWIQSVHNELISFFFFCVLPVPRRKCVYDRFQFPTV
jgi:hypothetical protein